MRKEGQTDFHNVAMLAFYGSILLMCMRARYMMDNAKLVEEWIKLEVLASLIRSYGKDLAIKLSLNKSLKILKLLKHIRFKFDKINPCEFTKIIHKANIIFFLPTDSRAGPNTSKCTNCKGNSDTPVDLGYGSWWLFACWQILQIVPVTDSWVYRRLLLLMICSTNLKDGWPSRLCHVFIEDLLALHTSFIAAIERGG
jgi:hypothetical protein